MKVHRIFAACLLLALVGCAKKEEAAKAPGAAVPASPPAVTVNGKAISQKTFEAYAESLARRPFAEIPAEDKEQIRENLARVELFAQDAEKSGLLQEPDVAAAVEIARLQVIQNATASKLAKDHEPTEAELRAEYEAQLASMPQVDFRARHIVVSGEDVALKILERLKSGGDFATLAKQMSTHKESATRGGEMGWFPPNVLGPDFATAVGLLKKGEITPRPVKSQMGWHIVQLEDTREATPPSFEQMQNNLARSVLTKRLTRMSDDLLKAAKVEPALNTESAKALTNAPAAPAAAPAPAAQPAPAPATN
jgi:peptidyl-prolyl cis-trans isomerase C